jgi:hypothetical protein
MVPPESLAFVVLPVGVVLVLVLSLMLAKASGWSTLATRFASPVPAGGNEFTFASGALSQGAFFPVTYQACLTVCVAPGGFSLALQAPFQFRSPALFIPWDQVESVQGKQSLGFFSAYVEIKEYDGCLKISGAAGRALAEAFSGRS